MQLLQAMQGFLIGPLQRLQHPWLPSPHGTSASRRCAFLASTCVSIIGVTPIRASVQKAARRHTPFASSLMMFSSGVKCPPPRSASHGPSHNKPRASHPSNRDTREMVLQRMPVSMVSSLFIFYLFPETSNIMCKAHVSRMLL
jgi:hypothetical protein